MVNFGTKEPKQVPLEFIENNKPNVPILLPEPFLCATVGGVACWLNVVDFLFDHFDHISRHNNLIVLSSIICVIGSEMMKATVSQTIQN